jgi:hypothetical protein
VIKGLIKKLEKCKALKKVYERDGDRNKRPWYVAGPGPGPAAPPADDDAI